MIGHSNAGKTTYMSSMYALGRAGIRGGFRIRTRNPAQEAELLRHAEEIRRGTYPPPSAQRTTYDFVLRHRRRDFFDFTWSDYRGGALLDRSTEADTTALLEDLQGADGIVVFADAHALLSDRNAPRQLRRLTVLLQRSVGEATRQIPLVIVYTKADLIPADPEVWTKIKEPLAAIATAANSGERIIATDIEVSCGKAPRNVEVPLLWCLGNVLADKVISLEKDLAQSRADAKRYQADSGIGDSISSWWNSVPSYAKMAEDARKDAKKERAELAPLKGPVKSLTKALVRYHPAGSEIVNAQRTTLRATASARRAADTVEVGRAVLVVLIFVVVFGGFLLFAFSL